MIVFKLSSISFTASSLSDSFGSSGGGISSNCRQTAHRQTSVPVPPSNTYLNGVDVTRNLDALEYPFLTMKTYPPGFIVHVGNFRWNF